MCGMINCISREGIRLSGQHLIVHPLLAMHLFRLSCQTFFVCNNNHDNNPIYGAPFAIRFRGAWKVCCLVLTCNCYIALLNSCYFLLGIPFEWMFCLNYLLPATPKFCSVFSLIASLQNCGTYVCKHALKFTSFLLTPSFGIASLSRI